MIFIEGLTLGFANNIFCIGTCVPALLPVVLGQKDKPVYPVLKFMTGRLIAYVLFGQYPGLPAYTSKEGLTRGYFLSL